MLQVIKSKQRYFLSGSLTAGMIVILCGLWRCAYAGTNSARSVIALRSFLQRNVGWGPASDKAMRYSFARVSLKDKKAKQVLVYVTGPGWCGSGGCTALLLEPYDSSFRVIDRFTLARLPIRILPSMTHGWHDLAMPVAGGGIIHRYIAILKFNGHSYPSNPSMAPKLPESLVDTGTKVPLSRHGSLVY